MNIFKLKYYINVPKKNSIVLNVVIGRKLKITLQLYRVSLFCYIFLIFEVCLIIYSLCIFHSLTSLHYCYCSYNTSSTIFCFCMHLTTILLSNESKNCDYTSICFVARTIRKGKICIKLLSSIHWTSITYPPIIIVNIILIFLFLREYYFTLIIGLHCQMKMLITVIFCVIFIHFHFALQSFIFYTPSQYYYFKLKSNVINLVFASKR